ncbi:MAG: TetR/AcrR family transcriptional regulator [Actinobacteria bacterium]|nr:TetR/AcrR family transcriptional regulator [Actinomycetota bacterium]
MARSFSKQEREIIRQRLVEKGRELFSTVGVKKTSIDELTQAVGIAKGSFYAFFNSKEEMYLDILEMEENSIRAQFMAQVIQGKPITKETFKSFILEGIRVMETNPLFRRMYEKSELEQVLRKVPPERLSRHVKSDEDWVLGLVTEWQARGLVIDADPQAITGAIKFVIASSLLKDSIGGQNYPQSIELLAELVAEGLISRLYGRDSMEVDDGSCSQSS